MRIHIFAAAAALLIGGIVVAIFSILSADGDSKATIAGLAAGGVGLLVMLITWACSPEDIRELIRQAARKFFGHHRQPDSSLDSRPAPETPDGAPNPESVESSG